MLINTINLFASSVRPCKPNTFFGLEPWYQYIDNAAHFGGKTGCSVKSFNILSSDLTLVLLAVVDDLLRIAGLVAFFFVLYGAVQFLTSEGNPEKTKTARHTVVNALVGLAIASISVVFVGFIGNAIGS